MKFSPTLFALLFLALLPRFVQAEDPLFPEEPDYAFVTGSPYTETRHFLQLILDNSFSDGLDAGVRDRQLSNSLRFEYGFSDRLEADFVLSFNDLWSRNNAVTGAVTSNLNGFGDTVLGLRYRILRESQFPITLTFGPQLLLPTGSFVKGFSPGGFGLAWDLTTGREWNRWFFHYLSLNYATTFSALDPTPGSSQLFLLHDLNWGIALGFRPLEKPNGKGGKNDLHLTLELDGDWGQSVAAGNSSGTRQTSSSIIFVPGLRYGYLTKGKTLTEIGLAGVIGLTSSAPDWGLILQTQFETGF